MNAVATLFTLDESDPRAHQGPALAIALLALLACATSLGNGFAYDDRWIIVDNPNVHEIGRWYAAFSETYWPSIRAAALYRPFTIIAYTLQWAAGDGTPLIFHTVNVMLYSAVCALMYFLAIQVLPRGAAWVAAALFAVHPVHVEAVGNVVGQAELWTSATLLASVAIYLRARRGGLSLDRETRIIICGLYFCGMLFKENAIVLPALLVAAEALLVTDSRSWRARADELFSLLVWLTLLAAAFLWVRVEVTGEIGGDVEHAALRNRTAGERAWIMLALAPEFARLLLWPARLYADYSPREIPLLPAPHPDHTSGALLLLCVVILAAIALRRFPLVTFAVAWIAITIAPVANIVMPTGILIAERTLFLPTVGAVLAVGSLVPWCVARLEGTPRSARLAAAGVLAIVLTAGAARSAERQRAWKDSETVFRTLAAEAPYSFKAHYANGGMLWEQRRPGEAEREWRYAIALFPEYFGVYQDLAHRYREAHVCQAAIPLYQQALAIEPALPFSRVGLAACHLELAQYRQARAVARRAISDSLYRPAFEYMICKADSALVATDSADLTIRWMPLAERRRQLAAAGLPRTGAVPNPANSSSRQNARSAALLWLNDLGPVSTRRCKSLLHSQ